MSDQPRDTAWGFCRVCEYGIEIACWEACPSCYFDKFIEEINDSDEVSD